MTESATHSPTPWSVSEAAFWRIYDAAGAEVVNAEGVVDAELSDRIVHAVNLHDEMVEALRDLNSALESNCDLPFSIKARKALGEDGVAAWLRVRFLLSKSTPTQKG